jgi:hypothetical protein
MDYLPAHPDDFTRLLEGDRIRLTSNAAERFAAPIAVLSVPRSFWP